VNYKFGDKTSLFIKIGLLIVGAAFLRGLTPEGYNFDAPIVWWPLIPIGLVIIFLSIFVEFYYEYISSLIDGRMGNKKDDWTVLIENPEAEKITSIIDALEDGNYQYFYEEEDKPIWEPMPHSTQKIYIKKKKLDEIENYLIEQKLLEE